MIKKSISNGIKVLKISTWLSVFLSLVIILIVGFFVTFPSFIKPSIEAQLSTITGFKVDLSEINFGLDQGDISLNIPELIVSSKQTKQTLALIKNLHWQVQLPSLLGSVYQPSQVTIDVLSINNTEPTSFSIDQIKQLVSKETLEIAHFFKSLKIKKTIIKAEQEIEIAPLVVSHDQGQLVMRISDQNINGQRLEVTVALSSEQTATYEFITLPITLKNAEFSLLSNLKLYQKTGQNYAEFSGFIKQIEVLNLVKYLPVVVGQSTNDWIKNGFKSGVLKNSNFHIIQNLSKDLPDEVSFTAHLTDAQLLFDADWQTLKNLDANISTDGKKIKVLVNNAQLYDLPLNNISLEIADINQPDLDLQLLGKINTHSKALLDFITQAPMGKEVHEAIKQFNLTGMLEAELDFLIPLNDRILTSGADSSAEINFTAHLTDAQLLFDEDWQTLKNLDANISKNGKNVNVLVNNAKLYDLPLSNFTLEIADVSQPNLNIKLLGEINASSEALIEFLAQAPVGEVAHEAIEKFSLTGPLKAKLDLLIPLDKAQDPTLNVDLTIQNNQLTILGSGIVVSDYDSKIKLHDSKISTAGTGNIRNIPFNIRINPSDRQTDQSAFFAVELTNQDNNFELYLTQQSEQTWHANIESEALKANIEIALSDNFPNVRIIDLKVATLDSLKGNWDVQPNDLPNMFLATQNVTVDGQQIPNFSAELASKDNILKITNLTFEGVGVNKQDLLFDGAWVAGKTLLIAKAKGEGLSEFLQTLKIDEKVTGGEFDFDVRIFCDCAPWNMSLDKASGIAQMSVKKGIFTDKDPNIGRVLSLLNIKTVAKRLQLDVSDLIDKGFVYDSIDAKITLQNSLASIDNFQLKASSSAITLSGESNVVDKIYDIEAVVTPAVSGVMPIAAYLAGGGLIGLGVWLVDEQLFDGKLFNKIIDKVAQFKYKITGPWHEPIIE